MLTQQNISRGGLASLELLVKEVYLNEENKELTRVLCENKAFD
ncbi:hypothetical protein [Brevibacillus choshinensis]|nr:hypothetical protein [Brevibacillus choshinensis]